MGFDVFNALDLMENKEFLEKLKFGIGDGNLQYYLYNWRCPQMNPHQVTKCYYHKHVGHPHLIYTFIPTCNLCTMFCQNMPKK